MNPGTCDTCVTQAIPELRHSKEALDPGSAAAGDTHPASSRDMKTTNLNIQPSVEGSTFYIKLFLLLTMYTPDACYRQPLELLFGFLGRFVLVRKVSQVGRELFEVGSEICFCSVSLAPRILLGTYKMLVSIEQMSHQTR